MEILVVMVLTILQVFMNILQAILIVAAVGVILSIVGLVRIQYSNWRYKQTPETSTDEDNFEESYARDPGKRLITAAQSERMWRELDKLNDAAILENTKDL